MEIIDKALEFETRKLSFQTTSDRIVASREVKSLILGVNEIYKENQDPELMDLMKRLTVIKKKIEVRLKGRSQTPKGADWDKAMNYWQTLYTADDAVFDEEFTYKSADIEPMITYGTNPGMGMGVTKSIPTAESLAGGVETYRKSLGYMSFNEGDSMIGKPIDFVFLGSCTNGRIEDFRGFCSIIEGRKKAENVTAWLVPGSHKVVDQIKAEGLDKIITAAGFVLREPGCSACLAMNDDKVPSGKLSVSTSNRNFEGRQGPGSRTLLASPLVAAASAVEGVVTDPRTLLAS